MPIERIGKTKPIAASDDDICIHPDCRAKRSEHYTEEEAEDMAKRGFANVCAFVENDSALGKQIKKEKMMQIAETIGYSIQKGLRMQDGHGTSEIWHLIDNLPEEVWEDVSMFAAENAIATLEEYERYRCAISKKED